MVHRPSKTPSYAAVLLLAAVTPFLPVETHAQAPPPVAPAQFDPSDVYFQGYLAARTAEQLEGKGDFVGAAEKLEQAKKLIDGVLKFYPEWKPDMVKRRVEMNTEASTRIKPKADEQKKKNEGAVAELEGGAKASGRLEGSAPMPLTPPGILEVDPLATRRLEEAQAEVRRLRQQLAAAGDNSEAARNASRVGDLRKANEDLAARLKAAETNVESLRARLSTSPAESEYKALNNRIENLERDREAMGRALSKSRNDLDDATGKIRILETDLGIARKNSTELRQKQANSERDLQTERGVANEVVSGLRRQLDASEKALKLKGDELEQATKKIAGLQLQLQQSSDAIAELQTEKSSLVAERNQMAALLKLNEAGRINQLIEQNMGLAKNLREATEKVETLNIDNNNTKDAWTESLRDLAMAKYEINRLKETKREQDGQLDKLTSQLKGEEAALARGEASADPAEVDMLRDIIKRQLRAQEWRRQSRDTLVDEAKKLGLKDENLAKAMELFTGEDLQLTQEEQRLIAERKVDGEFVSPFARDPAVVGRATDNLNQEMQTYDRAATKAYTSQRYGPAKELFQMIVESNPGDTGTLCKLGLVQMKLGDPMSAADSFRRAVELDANNAYAHRMLGLSQIELGDISGAEQSVTRSVELASDDAKSQILLGAILYSSDKTSQAEKHWKAAIEADPMLSEPHINLAALCAKAKRKNDARVHYQAALERGAVPDPRIEKFLDSRP